jgi:signal transduction histidine kinase
MSVRARSLLLCVYLLLFSLGSSKGQNTPSGYSITNYNSDNALPQNSINGMAFDRNGFLWLATEMGLVRFDGRNFREYNAANTPLMPSNRVATLSEDHGRILLITEFGNRRMFTVGDNYQLTVDSALSADPYQTNFRNNARFSYTNLYNRWAAGNPGVFDSLFYHFEYDEDLITANKDQAYMRKGRRYYYLDDATADVRPLATVTGHEFKLQFMIGDLYIMVDKQNRLFAYRNGVQQPVTGSGRLIRFLSKIDVTGPYPVQATLRVCRDTAHSFFAYKGTLLLLHERGGAIDFDTLVSNTAIGSVNCVLYDEPHKIIYIGTATSGLYILKKQEFKRLAYTSDNYAVNSMYAQLELPDGRLLSASGVLDRRKAVNLPIPGLYDRITIFRSSDDSIWYSSYGYARKMDPTFQHSSNVQLIGLGAWISSIFETPEKDVYFTDQVQLYRWRSGQTTLLLNRDAFPLGIIIYVIQPVDAETIWIGTNMGMYAYDIRYGTLRRVSGVKRATVRSIYMAKDGSIWIGTYGQGFYKYFQAHFVRMPTDPAGNLSTVHSFMEDDRGFFWLPTNKGLYRVSKRELDLYAAGKIDNVFFYYFDKSSGFASNEFNGACSPCGVVLHDGHFSLPSLDGFIQFQPDSITIVPPDRSIFIDRMAAGEKAVLPEGYFQQTQDAGPLVFAVSSPYFGNPANLHLEYSIPELDDTWHPLPSDGKLILAGLHQGDYKLIIRKQESLARYRYATIDWTILPYWYETIWFRLLVIAFITSIFFAVFWLRYTRQVKRAELLEQKVAERTVALSASNDVKEKMIAIILHDFRSPLRFLHMLAVRISENYKKVSEAELREMLIMFRNATRDLFEFAQDFLVWSNAQREGFVVKLEPVVVRDIVAEIVSLYEPGADIRNNTVYNLVPETTILVSDAHILKLVIRNLTDNANKYSLNSDIRIEAFEAGGLLRITITDSGRSMSREQIEQILNSPYQAGSSTQGFGYKIVLELLARIQGKLSIDTPGATGNRVTLLFSTL